MSKQDEKRTMKTHKPETQVIDLSNSDFIQSVQSVLNDNKDSISGFLNGKWEDKLKTNNHAQKTKKT